jgi:hypothetical protein
MTSIAQLRSAIIGLVGFAHAEEELLLAAAIGSEAEPGSPRRWAAVPLIAHNTEFKRQQVQRLDAIGRGQAPPVFGDIDHRSADVYRRYAQQPAGQVARDSREVTAALIDGLSDTGDDDLLIPDRNPWLAGRQLWLQIIVRGFWHPAGHLGDYYVAHGPPGRAVDLQAHAVATAGYLRAPESVRGMAYYNLACAQARSELCGEAVASLRQAVELNSALRANASRDADLVELRDAGQLTALLGS